MTDTSAARTLEEAVPLGLIPTVFQPRLEALSSAKSWMGWAGYQSAVVIENMEFEYFAIRNQSTLFDVSPMHKYRIQGADAEAMLNRMIQDLNASAEPGQPLSPRTFKRKKGGSGWRSSLKRTFEFVDRDRSGYVTVDEFERFVFLLLEKEQV